MHTDDAPSGGMLQVFAERANVHDEIEAREIGIRVALGASSRDILQMIVGRGREMGIPTFLADVVQATLLLATLALLRLTGYRLRRSPLWTRR